MPEFTVGERVLLHLYNYRTVNLDDYFNIPWDITQDGISTSLRISRAHASLELKKQKERGNIKDALVRIYGGKVRRLAYSLTENGIRAAVALEDRAKDSGIDVRTLTDMKRQDTLPMLESMRKDDRDALGIACAFRVAMPLDALPPHDRSVIPTDITGYTSIVPELRSRVMKAAPEKDVSEWHSYAADYFDKYGANSTIPDSDCRIVEIAYHQLKAGRYVDACKLINRNPYTMMLSDDRGLFEAIRDVPIESVKDRFRTDFLTVRAELALSQNDLKTAREASEALIASEDGQEYGYACLAKCLVVRNLRSEAEKTISKVNGSRNALAMLLLADAYVDLDDIPKAEEQLKLAETYISENNEAAVAKKFLVEARIFAAKGQIEDGNRVITKAFRSTDEIAKSNIRAISKNLGLTIGTD